MSIYQPEKGLAASAPVVGPDGMIYFGTQVGVHKLNKRLGKEIWHHKIATPEDVYSWGEKDTIGFIPELSTDGKKIYAASKKRVWALDIKTGRLLWENTRVDEYCGSPSIGPDGNLYLGAGGTSYEDSFKRILVLSAADGSIIRSIHTGGTLINLPVVMAKDRLYSHGQGSTHSYAIQGAPSQETLWGTWGQNARRTFCPENLTAIVMPPGRTVSWIYGENPKSLNSSFIGKERLEVLNMFGKPRSARTYEAGFKWTYGGLNIRDESGIATGTVTFDISNNRVSGVWIERNPLIPKDKPWAWGNSITSIDNIYKQKSAYLVTKVFGNPAISRINGNELVWRYTDLKISVDGRRSGPAIEFYLQFGRVTKVLIPPNAFPWNGISQVENYYKGRKESELLRDFGKPSKITESKSFGYSTGLKFFEYISELGEPRRHWVYNSDGKLSYHLQFEIRDGIITECDGY